MFKRYILPAMCTLALLPACKKECEQCYVKGERPMDQNDTISTYTVVQPDYIIRSKAECEALADSLNRDDSGVNTGIFYYKYSCACNAVTCNE